MTSGSSGITLNELIWDIRSTATGGQSSGELRLYNSQIEYWISIARAERIRNVIEKYNTVPETYIQTLEFQLKTINDRDSNVRFTSLGNILKVTTEKVPSPIQARKSGSNQRLFTYIGGIDYELSIEFSTDAINRWSKFNKYTANEPRAVYRDNYLYLYNTPLSFIKVSGVFENPLENNIIGLEEPYPIDAGDVSIIKQLVLEKHLLPYLQLGTGFDLNNNATDDAKAKTNNR